MVFFSTYKLYKRGTSQVVAWLGKTAARFGYELGSGDTAKQEKEIGPKSNGMSSRESASPVTKHTVSIRDLPVLAQTISEHVDQTVDFKTLPHILEVLKDVIVKRKQWAKAFGLPDASMLTSNMRHDHFISVLEDVYKILGGGLNALQSDKGQKATVVADGAHECSSTEEVALSNLFAVLDIEEPAEEVDTLDGEDATPGAGRSPPPRPKLPIITYELEDETDEEEVYFMIYCFFKDFQEVRQYIRQSWADYKDGQVDLVAVAVTTNVALEMLQRAETTLLASFPKKYNMTNYERVGGLLQLAVAHSRGVDPNSRQRRGDVINMDLRDVADLVCLPVYIILSSFLPVLQGPEHIPVLKPGHFGKLDMSGRLASSCWREQFNQNKIVLCELLPEFCILNRLKMSLPVVDELSRGLMDMMRTKAIPMWLVFGCQIYLDIHHTMLLKMGEALEELQIMGLHVSKTLEDYFEFSKGMSIDTWSDQNDRTLRIIKLEADLWVNQDFFAATQKKLFKSVQLPESSARPYSLLSRQPLLCGLILFRLNLRMQEAGVVLVSAWGSLPSVIHLYNAVKHELPKDSFPLWEDVEAIIRLQGKERIFVGDYPKKAIEYLKRFCLVMGYSASIFAQNRREGRHTPQTPASSRGPREMATTSALADVFRPQYSENETRSEVTFHKIDKLLNTSSLGKKFGTSSHHRQRQFTSVSFLSALQAHIQADILALNINYFALHFRCFNLLRTINVRLDPEFRKYVGPEYVERESELPFLVGHLFGIATGSGTAAETLKIGGRGVEVKSAVLQKAGEVVKDLVQREGDAETQTVKSVCHLV